MHLYPGDVNIVTGWTLYESKDNVYGYGSEPSAQAILNVERAEM